MSESKRKVFTGTQKAKVALEAIKGTKAINEIAQEHGVHPNQVSQWKKERLGNAGSLFEGKRGPKAVNAQSGPDRLYAKIGQLNMELDWLIPSGAQEKSPGSACRRTPELDRADSVRSAINAMQASQDRAFGDL